MDDGHDARTDVKSYPLTVHVQPDTEERNRLTVAFRFFLAIPHILLVGAPVASAVSLSWSSDGSGLEFGGGGLLSAVVAFAALIAWIAILFTGRHPDGLWKFFVWYLRWRVRAIAYLTLLRDEYPPFGQGEYPVALEVSRPPPPRDRLTVAFRLILALPHILVLWFLGVAWSFTTAIAWVVLLFTGRYPETLYGFALGVLAWTTRVEGYLLLLRDEYPPFTLRA